MPLTIETKERLKGHLAALFTSIINGVHVTMTKSIMSGWMTPMGYNISRMTFAFLFFWTLSLFNKKEKVSGKDFLLILLGGFLGMTFNNVAFSIAMNYTTPAIWSIIIGLAPITVLVLSGIFMKEKITFKKTAGIVLGLAGAMIIITRNLGQGVGRENSIGVIITIVTLISLSVYMLITRKLSMKYSAVTQMKWATLLTIVLIGPVGFPELPAQRIFSAQTSLVPILQLIFILVFGTVIASFLMPVALKRIDASTSAIYINAQPVVASITSIAIGQDVPGWDKLAALVLVIAGVYLATRNDSV